jgi:hypothetical protein
MRATLKLFGTAFIALLAAQAMSAAGQTKADPKANQTPSEERLICRSFHETGSLVKRRRQCFTRAQWDRIAEAARLRGEDLRGGAFAEESN